MERSPLLRPGGILTSSGPGGIGGPAHPTMVPFGAEASPPFEDQSFRLAPCTRRLMTRSVRQRMVPDSPVECPLCKGAVEDCSHLFFVCLLAQVLWQVANVGRLMVTSEEAFWGSLGGGTFHHEAEWQTIFATLWSH